MRPNSGFQFLIGYVIPRSLRIHLISNACILLSKSVVMVHVSRAYKNMDMARERINLGADGDAYLYKLLKNYSQNEQLLILRKTVLVRTCRYIWHQR